MNGTGGGGNVTWRWVAATVIGVLVLGMGGWMTTMQAQVSTIQQEQKRDGDTRGKLSSDVEVLKEQVKQLQKSTDEIKVEQRMQTEKLNELLRRSR